MQTLHRILGCSYSSGGGSNSTTPTIFALATGGYRSAVAVLRISGPKSLEVLQSLGRFRKPPQPRVATLRKLYDPSGGRVPLDHGLVLWFPGPSSYTGEDCVELQVHGGPAVVRGLLSALSSIPGLAPAPPGEFTRRAFLNGKMDLTEVDGLGDLIAAETEMQRSQAVQQIGGRLRKVYHGWRERLAKCVAATEAFIDFGEDEGMEGDVLGGVTLELAVLIGEIEAHLQDGRRGQRLRNGARVAIVGEPNVGKSTLLNKLSGRDAAIVSNIPGTTRDVIESCVNLEGYPVIFADTAGIREETSDEIEIEGMKRSVKEIQEADLIIFLIDLSSSSSCVDKVQLQKHLLLTGAEHSKTIVIGNKCDIMQPSSLQLFDATISCKTNSGMEKLHELLKQRIIEICGDPLRDDAPHVTQERYRTHLLQCVSHLQQFLAYNQSDLALRTHFLKEGINSIGAITGSVGTEEILDILFRDFCIGK